MTILRAGARTKVGFASAHRGTTKLLVSNATWTACPYITESEDTDAIWEPTTNPSRFLTPSWAQSAQMGSQIYYEGSTTGQRINTHRLNGSEFVGRGQSRRDMHDATWETHIAWSSPVPVATPGTDYYECWTYQDSGVSRNLAAAINWGSLIVQGFA